MSGFRINALRSEIDELEKILQSLPDDAVIERKSFEKRLNLAVENLNRAAPVERETESVRLTFRGSPVDASHGISADFAGKASEAFANAFSALLAGRRNRLGYMGPIPDKNRYPLMITGTAVGSFGFEIELPKEFDLIEEVAGADEVIQTLKSVLRVTAEGTDEQVADFVEEIHPRAVRKIADFLEVLDQNDAWCGLEFRDDFFKYENIDQLRLSEARLKADNIVRSNQSFFGEFQGFLPQGRTFEFKPVGDDSVVKGKIDPAIEDADILNREWLHRPVHVNFSVVQVGQGRPRFTLMSLNDIQVRRV